MTKTTKIIIALTGVVIISAFVYAISEDAKRKRYDNTVVPPDYALKLIQAIK